MAGGNVRLETVPNNETVGVLYANVKEGTELKRFYTDPTFTQAWIPPFQERFYVFQTTKDYDPQNINRVTDFPYYCAEFDAFGEVKEQLSTTPNSQTAWDIGVPADPNSIFNASYNISYTTI